MVNWIYINVWEVMIENKDVCICKDYFRVYEFMIWVNMFVYIYIYNVYNK